MALLLCARALLLCARFEEVIRLSATSDRSTRALSALADPSRVFEPAVESTSDLAGLLILSTSLTPANLLLFSGGGNPDASRGQCRKLSP
jgi:hypothetical protein